MKQLLNFKLSDLSDPAHVLQVFLIISITYILWYSYITKYREHAYYAFMYMHVLFHVYSSQCRLFISTVMWSIGLDTVWSPVELRF